MESQRMCFVLIFDFMFIILLVHRVLRGGEKLPYIL